LKEKPLGHNWSILFWTQEQLTLLEKFKSGKSIVLCGDYGTGKTSLLVFAALEAAKDPNSEVFFIPVTNIFNSMDTNNHNVLDEAVKMKFEGTNVRVITIGDLGIHRGNHSGGDERHHLIREFLNTMSQKRSDIKVFIDELPLYEKDLKDIMDPIKVKNTQFAAPLNLLDSKTTQTWVALSTLSLLDNSEDPDKPLLPYMRTQTHSILKSEFYSSLRLHLSLSTKFDLQELWLRVRNSSSIGNGIPEEISELSTAAENFQTSVIKGASSEHTVVGLRPTFMDLQGLKDDDFKLCLNEVFSNILKIKVPLRESIVILCGEGISVQKVSEASAGLGLHSASFPQSPTAEQKQQLRSWLKGAGGLLVTSNLQFAGMEAPTCIFITNNIIKEIGARSGLLRATSRLVVVSYTKDVNIEEVWEGFVLRDSTTIREEMRKEERRKHEEIRIEERRKYEEKMRKMEPVAAEVDDAAKKGDIAGIKQLQQRVRSGTPLLLELRSTSGAGEYWGDQLGVYHLTTDQREESLRQGLVYLQLHCGPGCSET